MCSDVLASDGRADAGTVLQARELFMRFGPVVALRTVSFEMRPGEIVALVGDNGAGKSTVVKILSGVVRQTGGSVAVDGTELTSTTPAAAQRAGIQTVFQSLSLVPTLDITENIYLHRELRRPGAVAAWLRWMDRPTMRRRAAESLARLGVELPSLRTKVAALSGGQRQAVAIARALLWGGRIVLLDEPTAALGVRQTEIVLSYIERLRERQVAVMVVSHNMEDVLRISDRIIVLRLGRKIAELQREEATHERLVHLMSGLE